VLRNSVLYLLAVHFILTQCYSYYDVTLHYVCTANSVLLHAMLIVGNWKFWCGVTSNSVTFVLISWKLAAWFKWGKGGPWTVTQAHIYARTHTHTHRQHGDKLSVIIFHRKGK
jgi:hypothetical protein